MHFCSTSTTANDLTVCPTWKLLDSYVVISYWTFSLIDVDEFWFS